MDVNPEEEEGEDDAADTEFGLSRSTLWLTLTQTLRVKA